MCRPVLVIALVALSFAALAVHARHHRTVAAVHKASASGSPPESHDGVLERAHEELKKREYARPESTHGQGKLGRGTFGVDVSSPVDEGKFRCMKHAGYDFVVARGFMESCEVDPAARGTVEAAWKAGMKHVDLYLFPWYGCRKSAAEQMDALIDSMGKTPFGKIWLDIESGGQGSPDHNHKWLKEALDQGKKRIGAKRLGIYSSQYEWGQVMGKLSGPTEYPVWYADYDGRANFDGFLHFGGWSHPDMKQFAGTTDLCGASVDKDWY